MIVTVTLNPAVDKYSEIDEVNYDEPIRIENTNYDAGGKGINISRVLKRFGADAPALYFSGGNLGTLLDELLEHEQVSGYPIHISETTRLNYAIYDRSVKKIIKLNDLGPSVDDKEMKKMIALIRSYAKNGNIIVLSGNLPQQVEADTYARIIEEIKEDVKSVFLDTESDILETTLQQTSPEYVKPNRFEMERLMGKKLKSDADFIEGLNYLSQWVKYPMISAGERGLYYIDSRDGETYRCVPPEAEVLSTVGAGDSFIAGFLLSISEEKPMSEAVKLGVACGTAAVSTPGNSLCYPKDVLDILDRETIMIEAALR